MRFEFIAKHRGIRLMRVHVLKARPRRRRLPKDDGLRSVIADNLLGRQFHGRDTQLEVDR